MPATSAKVVLTTNCVDCGVEKRFDQYAIKRGRHLNLRCRSCGLKFVNLNRPKRTKEQLAEYQRKYYQANKQKLDQYSNGWREAKRLDMIKQAGGKCVCCGEDDPIVLDFDHINDDGAVHRKQTKRTNVVNILATQGLDLTVFQLLCKNCNWKKEYARRKNASKIPKAA